MLAKHCADPHVPPTERSGFLHFMTSVVRKERWNRKTQSFTLKTVGCERNTHCWSSSSLYLRGFSPQTGFSPNEWSCEINSEGIFRFFPSENVAYKHSEANPSLHAWIMKLAGKISEILTGRKCWTRCQMKRWNGDVKTWSRRTWADPTWTKPAVSRFCPTWSFTPTVLFLNHRVISVWTSVSDVSSWHACGFSSSDTVNVYSSVTFSMLKAVLKFSL